MSDLKEAIKQKCVDAGFSNARFSKSELLSAEGKQLEAWLLSGHHASMQWMERNPQKRIDPSLILEDVQSVISLAYLYDTPYEHSENRNIPKISRYAWGRRDYHNVIKSKLKQVCDVIESLQEGARSKAYVDDGPVMDKAWAARSGLGWMGKNTNIIDNKNGSFFFIATILTNLSIEPDHPVEDLCKDCTLCINACPTSALFEEYKLDAGLCISFQTIENRSQEITDVDLHGWIFGCDICQDVCPFNRPGTFTDDENFIPNNMIFGKSYDELLSFSEDDFKETFSGTPLMRTKYSGWKRNLTKALNETK
jgi:epoxyqueuosine reductase